MFSRTRIALALAVLLAVVLNAFNIPLASSQGVTIAAARMAGDLPTRDPDAAMWGEATAVEVPLSAQTVTAPKLLEASVRSVTVRALHNDEQLALLVVWDDATQDDSTVRTEDFRDSVAVQFPLVEGQPFFCMGQTGSNVNIWHWKADWQADMVARQDVETVYPDMSVNYYQFTDPALGVSVGPGDYDDSNYLPALASGNLFASAAHLSPVEDLIAGGFGTLTSQPKADQNVQGYGLSQDGTWRVIFSRDLVSSEADDVRFETGQVYFTAFAVWDGANGERNGRKSTSQWVSLQLESVSRAEVTDTLTTVLWILGGIVIVSLIAATWLIPRGRRRT